MDLSGILGAFGGGGGSSNSTSGSAAGSGLGSLGLLGSLFGGSGSSPDPHGDGRLSRNTFVVVTSTLYALAVVAFLLRMYIRVVIQRHIYADDGFNILALILLTISMAAFYIYKNEAFAEEDLVNGDLVAVLESDILSKGLLVRKWLTAAAMMLWTAINCAKFSFLFFFRRLITRLRWFTIYWWGVLLYVTVVWAWGMAVFIIPCPDLSSLANALQCITGTSAAVAVRYSFAQVALDIFGDLLILAIPVKLIWQVKIRWTQKIGLTTSLCLSIAMVGTSAARATGILRHGFLNSLWIIFWYFNSANISLVLSSAAAFRTLYLAHRRSRSAQQQHHGHRHHHQHENASFGSSVVSRVGGFKSWFLRVFRPARFTPRNTLERDGQNWPKQAGEKDVGTTDSEFSGNGRAPAPAPIPAPVLRELPRPPRAMLTGIRSFIGRNGRDSYFGSTFYIESDEDEEGETRRFG